MSDVPDKCTFVSLYSGQAPWDIGRPQKAFIDMADQITGSLLDAGCGTGENALYFAGRCHETTGIDYLAEPIIRAKQKAAERGLTATFLVMDALALKELPESSTRDRQRPVPRLQRLATVLKPGGKLFLLCFSDDEPGTQGPRRVSRKEIEVAFAEGWKVESIEPSRYEVRLDLKDITFSDGGPKAWFAVIRPVA
jgi:SAM-dependent methyltransferase